MFGHLHNADGVHVLEDEGQKKWFINVGGISRGTMAEEDLKRDPMISLITFDADKEIDATAVRLKCKPPEEVFDLAWKHEQHVTKLIYNLMDIAVKESDFSTQSFLKWFVDEQFEEEAAMLDILDKIKFFGNEKQGLYLLDKELAARTFTPPPAE